VSVATISRPRLHHSGDGLVLVEFASTIAPEVNRRAVALAAAIAGARVPGVRDVVPAYASVGVHVDPLRFRPAALDAVVSHAWDTAAGRSRPRAWSRFPSVTAVPSAPTSPRSRLCRLRRGRRHRAPRRRPLRVYLLGFLPGFAYLGSVDETIAMPRRSTPRTTVPGGSVGIAGRQTGVYPCDSPGGWRLIGRTPRAMFDLARPEPALLAPGDLVRFVPTSHDRWTGRPA
jgi:inhibitor of KinA